MKTSIAGLLELSLTLALLTGCQSSPPEAPPTPTEGPREAPRREAAALPPLRQGPTAPDAPGETTALPGVRCLAPARLAVVRLGAGTTLPEARGPIAPSLVVVDGRTALLVAGGRVVEATTGAPLALARGGAKEPVVGSLGRRASGALLLVVGDQLTVRTRDGLAPLVPLPGAGWQVTCGGGAVYVHDPAARPGAVHAIADDLRAAKLLELPEGVSAVCATRDGVAIGTSGVVWSLAPDRQPIAALRLEGYTPSGLAQDPRTGTLFTSDGAGVFAVIDGVALPLVEGLGGTLACVDEGDATALWILDPARRTLARVAPLDWIGR